MRRDWDEKVGDRMIKLVVIGQHLDREQIEKDLDSCLDQFLNTSFQLNKKDCGCNTKSSSTVFFLFQNQLPSLTRNGNSGSFTFSGTIVRDSITQLFL